MGRATPQGILPGTEAVEGSALQQLIMAAPALTYEGVHWHPEHPKIQEVQWLLNHL